MRIGVPKEIKNNENRVAMTPAGVVNLVNFGHEVFIENGAGLGSGFLNEDYKSAGAKLVDSAEEAWSMEMVMKVKEPLPSEYKYFREGLILFTYLHLAPEPELTKALIDHKVIGIAYETVQLPNRSLPLLTPMSEVAGRMAPQIGAQFLEKVHGEWEFYYLVSQGFKEERLLLSVEVWLERMPLKWRLVWEPK